MGIKGAAAYFQQVMATFVLVGLIHIICECYQDDILTYGETEEEFLQNLRKIFLQLRKCKLTVNPKKCQFGLQQIEYVGHIISHEGISISKEKREEVFNVEKPTLQKHLKSFIGCAEYFHTHIRDFSGTMRPLHEMVRNYEKNRKLVWTQEAEISWDLIRNQIRDCPTLYFMDPNAPIYLHTDASDYGIGAYLFQVIDGKDQPIAFMSKSLSGAELRWSTIEKECYAIVYALKKFEYLIRDTHFTLRTDHRNLLYVNTAPNSKVARWKLLIQVYDFDIQYIPGPDNFVADAFSRLVPFLGGNEELHLLDEFDIPKDKYKIIGQSHNSTVGHFGVEKTLSKITEPDPKTGAPRAEPWPHMREHVKRFIKRCPICQKLSTTKINIQTDLYTNATYDPMERLSVDTIGPLEKDEYGNCYIIVVIDCFTRWVELFSAPDATAKSAARALLSHTGRFGQPHQLISDNGPQFVNEVLEALCDLLGIEHLLTVPYSHEENSIVERVNKEIMRHLRALVFDKKTYKLWSDNLPIIQRIINTSVHDSIGISPAQLLLGNATTLHTEMFVPQTQRDQTVPLSEWASVRLKQQELLLSRAKLTQQKHDKANLQKRTEKRNPQAKTDPQSKQSASPSDSPDTRKSKRLRTSTTNTIADDFKPGDLVLVSYPDNSLGKGRPPHKLMMPLRGPYAVVSKLRGSYKIQTGISTCIHTRSY
jgi:transposase InsO family protein